MEKTSKELLKEFVNSQNITSTTDIMNSMKELFSDVLQTVMEVELEEKLGYEKSERVSNYRRRKYVKKLSERVLEKDGKNAAWGG